MLEEKEINHNEISEVSKLAELLFETFPVIQYGGHTGFAQYLATPCFGPNTLLTPRGRTNEEAWGVEKYICGGRLLLSSLYSRH